MKARTLASIVAGIVLFCLLILLAVRYAETLHAERAAAFAVQPNMTRTQVVESLGVLYDGYEPGEYKDVDSVISHMENSDSIAYICCWRIAHSWDRYWVGFDQNESVVATHLETNRP